MKLFSFSPWMEGCLIENAWVTVCECFRRHSHSPDPDGTAVIFRIPIPLPFSHDSMLYFVEQHGYWDLVFGVLRLEEGGLPVLEFRCFLSFRRPA